MNRTDKIFEPVSPGDRALAQSFLGELRGGASLVMQRKQMRMPVPPFIARQVEALLAALAEGEMPLIASADEEVSTQQAAVFLKLSRPTVVKLMDEGRIPFRKPGSHRRVRVADLVAFKHALARDQDAALDELSALGQDALNHAHETGTYHREMM